MDRKRLIDYSIFSISFLSLSSTVKADAVYSDIEPDIVLENDGDIFFLDMDENGANDFAFLNSTWIDFTTDSFYSSRFERIFAGPQSPLNFIAASTDLFGTAESNYYYVYFPYALSLGDTINTSRNFENYGFQRMAFRSYTWMTFIGTVTWAGGNWYPEVSDHFLGVKFIDIDSCYHYGWIRCDVAEDGRKLVIKDFAFESKCGVGILAGDTVGDTTTVAINEINSLNVSIYSFNNLIYINLNELLIDVEIRIYDLNGNMIYSDGLKNQFTQIELNEKEGIHLVELVAGENKFIRKVFIN